MIGHARDPSAKYNTLGHGQSRGNEQIRCRNVLPYGGEVLTNPGFPVSQLVKGDNLRQVIVQGLRRVGPWRMQGHSKVANVHTYLLLCIASGCCATLILICISLTLSTAPCTIRLASARVSPLGYLPLCRLALVPL